MTTNLKTKARAYDSDVLSNLLAEISPEEQERIHNQMMMAARIADGITAKGWSKQVFAQKIGQTPSVISKWLSGTHNFTLDTLSDIQRVLGIQLLCVKEEKPQLKEVVKVEYKPIYVGFQKEADSKSKGGASSYKTSVVMA